MVPPKRDWLNVVFGAGLEQESPAGDGEERPRATEIVVRHAPGDLSPAEAPGRELRVRVTVAPPEPGTRWTLQLEADDAESLQERPRIWWRMEGESWQPMMSSPQLVATGRDRVRLDVDLRAAAEDAGIPAPRLQFTVESGN